MHYLGEHLAVGQAGHFFILLSLVASLLATISFYKANRDSLTSRPSWMSLAKTFFFIETISVVAIIVCLYYMLAHHYFEYKYVWEHSDKSLQPQYILSCLWEGQEGSFLLWSFWHCILGWIVLGTTKRWSAPVMMTVSFAQFCLATMLLGIYIGSIKIGTNPFVLLRNEGILQNAPIFQDPQTGGIRSDYLLLLTDGSGLNALLQNYWMVIHPPVLFLGFASTLFPFSFAIAGLWNKNHEWTKLSVPWSLFSMAALGTGIMMGAAWAYESLTFGGYWAWDPVENASLVPWLILVGGLHTNVVYNHTQYSLKTTYVFYILTFILILYSTFLTRSGILGDTSVHAFTGADMNVQLLLFVFIFLIPSFVLFFKRNRSIPVIHKEENTYSREFWMFIGSLILLLSAAIIIGKTSLPVFNKLFGTKLAPPEDVEFSYNQIQIFIAILIGVLTALTQFLKYKSTPPEFFGKKILWPTLLSVIISFGISLFGHIQYQKHGMGYLLAIHLAIFASIYAVIGNVFYIGNALKGNLKKAGPSVAHIGFGLMLLGILISSSKKNVLSWNTTGISTLDAGGKENPAENITLFKGTETDMGTYQVQYVRDTFNTKNNKKYFEIVFKNKEGNEAFRLYPNVIKNNKGQDGFSANPAAKHSWNKDIFAYVTSWVDPSAQKDTNSFKPVHLAIGDTGFYSNGMLILNKANVENNAAKSNEELKMKLDVTVLSKNGKTYKAEPAIAVRGNELRSLPDTVSAQSLIITFNKVIDEQKGILELGVKESAAAVSLLTLKVYEFPFITILWIGVIIMVIGCVMSMARQIQKLKRKPI